MLWDHARLNMKVVVRNISDFCYFSIEALFSQFRDGKTKIEWQRLADSTMHELSYSIQIKQKRLVYGSSGPWMIFIQIWPAIGTTE
jgi:hypothetical protein